MASLCAALGQHLEPVSGFDAPHTPVTAVHINELLTEPAKKAGGDEQLGAGVAGRGPAGGGGRSSAQDLPGGVDVQQPAMLGLLDAAEQGGGDPGLEPGQGFVSGLEYIGCDQDVS